MRRSGRRSRSSGHEEEDEQRSPSDKGGYVNVRASVVRFHPILRRLVSRHLAGRVMPETLREDHKFDWVQAMSSCTVKKVFECLKEEVEGDLEKFQSCDPQRARCLKYVLPEPDTFGIEGPLYGVLFDLMDKSTIKVTRVEQNLDNKTLMKLSVELDEEGECMLVDGEGKSWLRWQVRRQALEGIFFGVGQ